MAMVAGRVDHPVAVRTEAGEIELTNEAGRAVLLLLEELSAGGAVHVVAADAELPPSAISC